jgi:hypothetical protein
VWLKVKALSSSPSTKKKEKKRKKEIFCTWWRIAIISALDRWRQLDSKFKAILGYMVRPGLKKKKK